MNRYEAPAIATATATVSTIAAPRSPRDQSLADNYEAGRQVAPFILLFLLVIAAGAVGLVVFIVKARRRRAEMLKIASQP